MYPSQVPHGKLQISEFTEFNPRSYFLVCFQQEGTTRPVPPVFTQLDFTAADVYRLRGLGVRRAHTRYLTHLTHGCIQRH